MTLPTFRVRLQQVLPAPVDLVFQAWTDPYLLSCWFAPADGIPTKAEVDLRVGGRYRIEMGRRTAAGEYLEITPPTRLVFTWVWLGEDEHETVVTAEFTPLGKETLLSLTHDRLPEEVDCMGFEAGWEANLARLVRLLANQSRPDGTDVP